MGKRVFGVLSGECVWDRSPGLSDSELRPSSVPHPLHRPSLGSPRVKGQLVPSWPRGHPLSGPTSVGNSMGLPRSCEPDGERGVGGSWHHVGTQWHPERRLPCRLPRESSISFPYGLRSFMLLESKPCQPETHLENGWPGPAFWGRSGQRSQREPICDTGCWGDTLFPAASSRFSHLCVVWGAGQLPLGQLSGAILWGTVTQFPATGDSPLGGWDDAEESPSLCCERLPSECKTRASTCLVSTSSLDTAGPSLSASPMSAPSCAP